MSSTSRRLAQIVGAGLFGLAVAGVALPLLSPEDDDPRRVFTIESDDITESSSLVISTARPGLVYTTNDSGDDAVVYVLDADDGEVVGHTTLSGVDAVDIEALAGGSDRSLVVADIGDNDAKRDSVTLYRISQPLPGEHSVTASAVELTYVDGQRDAESVLYDADSGRAFVISKGLVGAQVYQTEPDVFEQTTGQLRPVAAAPAVATDATFLPGHSSVVIRSYGRAAVYTYPGWAKVASMDLPPQEQGESVAAPSKGTSIWIGSEGEDSEVLEVALPRLTQASAPGSEATPTPASSSSSGETAAPPSTQAPGTDENTAETGGRLGWLARSVLLVTVPALVLLAALALFSRRRPSS
ncbi:MAG: hypothetical protein H0V49_13735 [Nocardioidaceae bacterium]|nr:hypothetical protein [Nocardioidaceae bacterium]